MWSRQSPRRDGFFLLRAANRNNARPRRIGRRPRLEVLEDRQLLSVSGALQFDFGPSGAPSSPGYIAVGSTPFSTTAGYGWQAPATVYTGSDWWPGYNQVASTYAYSTGNTFEVDLPNGTYTVVPTLGSYWEGQSQVAISLNGQQVASNLATVKGQHISPAYQVNVTSGKLDVQIEDGQGTPGAYFWLDALSVLPGQVQPPTASAGPAITAAAGKPVSFSQATATGTGPLSYSWYFGDYGQSSGVTTSTGSLAPTYVYTAPGVYQAMLTVTDANGLVVLSTVAVTVVTGSNLTADAGPAQTSQEGTPTAFTGSVTGGTAPYDETWNFGDGATAAGTLTPTHVYTAPGSYTATLTVTDATGQSSSSSVLMSVSDVAPTVSLTAPSTGTAGTAVSFTASASDISPIVQAAGFTYKWNFGDGNTGAGADPSHVYSKAGTYNVSVTASDEYGETSMQATAAIVIAAATLTNSPTINIDANWLQQQGSGPYLLSQADTTYVLQTDVTVPGTAFVVTATGVTFDLNGHTITYDNAPPITVPNGGFESGSTPTDVPDWDVSQAPGAVRKPARTGMWGNWMLELPNVTSTQTITSQAISIPRANVQYAAAITPRSLNYSTIVTLSVVDAVTGAVLASKASSNANRGFAAVAQFTPTTTDPVKLVVTVAPAAGTTDTVDLDYASVMASQNYGVVASPAFYEFPAPLGNLIQGHTVADFTLKNGSIQQGQGDGYGSSPVEIDTIQGCTISNVKAAASGMDTNLILGGYAKNVTIENCNLVSNLNRISNRMLIFAAINLNNAEWAVTVNGNTFSGAGQDAIYVAGNSLLTSATINGNTSTMTSLVTDGYAFYGTNLINFQINNNTFTSTNGRGIMFDSYGADNFVQNGTVSGNYVSVQEGPDLEYGPNAMEATALRLRNNQGVEKNITFSNNSFIASTGPGQDWAAIGARISEGSALAGMVNAGLVFENNLFEATTTDGTVMSNGLNASQAWALSISTFNAGTGTIFEGNTLNSNCVSLMIGDNDSYGSMNEDVLFVNNTITKASQGAVMPYHGIEAGAWNNSVTNIRLIDMHYTNGAAPGVYFINYEDTSVQTKDVEFGYLLNINVTNSDGTAAAGAAVTITDSNGKLVFTGTTDAKGQLSSIPLVAQIVAQTGQNPETTTTLGAFTITVTSGNVQTTRTFTLTSDQNLGITL